ncbi:hypothetical protein C8J57DRAFT_1089163 [Mycena rebaudengoi]|nr:hypothetical protein C8J57DRAFT_1089163 [Mycena rebaudengoi]
MAANTPMPARGDRNAPQFDSSKPHELRRYFADLEYLLNRATITNDTEKKMHATRFLSVEDQEIWEALDSFSDANQTYGQFKSAVLKLYAGNDEERRFELADLDAIIGQYSRVGILSMEDLTTFYRQFLRITTYLIQKNRLSAAEQSRSFLRAMQPPAFALEVKQRLQIKKPDVHPADPYALADIYAAAEFVLAGSGGTLALAAHGTPAASTSTPSTIEVKPDPGIAALVSTMAKLIEVLATQKTSDGNFSTNGNNGGQKRTRPDGCGYCSDLNHFINDCTLVLADINAGKCKRNADNRVVLPSGAFVPRTITGKDLRTRIEKWHELNPGQLAAAQLMVDVAVEHLSTPASTSTHRTYSLTDEQRMQVLQHEMNALSTRAQAKRALKAKENKEEPDRTIPPSVRNPPVADATPASTAEPTQPAANTPPHPFANVRDAAYAPPKDRNAGLPAAVPSKAGPAYRSTAPVYNEKDAAEVFESTLDTPVTITQRQLLSIAPEVRSHMREVTTARRAPPKDNKNTGAPASQFLHDVETSSYTNSAQVNLPAGGIVVPDPYSVYYDSGVIPDDLIVSMESSAIRSILPVIDNQQQIECIVDGGSQIIAMAEAVCHELALSYDPRIILRMQSANGSVNPSLGLARNVPFRIGDITLYLQVHIVRNPAYDVLLGRPFDVLTQSIVRNFANEDQTITICDPNSGKLATVPTVPRGPPRHRQQGFPNSRN